MTTVGPLAPCVLRRTDCASPLVLLLMFCSWFFSLEALTRRVAGAPHSHSGPTAGRSPRLSLRPLNISTSQVGAGAHPVTADPYFLSIYLSICLSVLQLLPFFHLFSQPYQCITGQRTHFDLFMHHCLVLRC